MHALKQRLHEWNGLRRDGVVMFVDLHGHSRSTDVFMYGCANEEHCRERLFPYLCQQFSPAFNFSKCDFRVQQSKRGTGRVVVWRELGVQNSFTLGVVMGSRGIPYGCGKGSHL